MKTFAYLLFVYTILALPNFARANDDKIQSACPSRQKVYSNILNCGENANAAKHAQICANYMASFNRASGLALQREMNKLESSLSSHQSKNFVDTAKRLHSALKTLKTNIALLQTQTALVASYTDVMIDFPEGVDDNSSASCFSSAFHDLQKVVSGMDKEIILMKNAYRTGASLLKTAASHSQNLSSLIPQVEDLDARNSSLGASPPQSPTPRGKKIRSSDISGTKDESKNGSEEKKRP